ncbi:MAG TPA: hypothetical protein DIW17_16765, partial [Clostridiales bacterium]|nr:hypothetical protein [Clostridiales bacterium]
VIYDGIWVGKNSHITNIDGIRLDVIEGCREVGIGAMRWPGGCCADHYHWKNGVGKNRQCRYHPMADVYNPVWNHDFGTDEFLKLCELTSAEPIITVNTATGTQEEFLDWYEYVNGSINTKYGQMRAENGHEEPYNVKFWGIGNTDENVWHIDYNNPIGYAKDYLSYQTVLRNDRENLYFIGLGLSTRHKLPGWVGKMLDHVTRQQRDRGPDALSIHHYLGGAKQGGELCGSALEYTDEEYYALLSLLDRYQYDIDLHRSIIHEHTNSAWTTDICFDEWGIWHPDAEFETGQNQPQTLRDAIFAAMALHVFYRNSDVVKFAMETQLSNLLQSLFETDGERFYKTPTFYVMKLFREHIGQYIIPVLSSYYDDMLDLVATISEDGNRITVSIVNKHLYDNKSIEFITPEGEWFVSNSEIVYNEDVHMRNDFESPTSICNLPFEKSCTITLPPHSVARLVVENIHIS